MSRKDLDEKLAEARGIMERAELMGREASPIPLTAAGSWLVDEVDRLRKIEDGVEKIIAMRKQVAESLRAEADDFAANHLLQSAQFNRATADRLMGEVWPLEALLHGE